MFIIILLQGHSKKSLSKKERRAVGLTFFNYSMLAQETEIGRRSFPLTGLAQLSGDLREMVLAILLHPPVSDILHISAYTPSPLEIIPITSLQPMPAA